MSLRDQIQKSRQMASALTQSYSSVEVTLKDPTTGTEYEILAKVSDLVEGAEGAAGGMILTHDGESRWPKMAADGSANPVPARGWVLQRKSGGRVYQVDRVHRHDNDVEWKVELMAM